MSLSVKALSTLKIVRGYKTDNYGLEVITGPTPLNQTYCAQRRMLIAGSRVWVFYNYNSKCCVVSALLTDISTWSSVTEIADCKNGGRYISVYHDGTYLHIAVVQAARIMYRRGTLNSDGTITWSAAEQTAVTTSIATEPFMFADSSGYPWIGYGLARNMVTKSSTNDGTWVADSGFPYELTDTFYGTTTTICENSAEGVYVFYTGSINPNRYIYCQYYDGAWSSQQVVSVYEVSGPGSFIPVVGEDDYIHIVYTAVSPTLKLRYLAGVYDDWTWEIDLGTITADGVGVTATLSSDKKLLCYVLGEKNASPMYMKCGIIDIDSWEIEVPLSLIHSNPREGFENRGITSPLALDSDGYLYFVWPDDVQINIERVRNCYQ